jgi:anti-anti-sigma factor
MGFAVERTAEPDGVCVAVAGEVDIDTAPRLRLALAEALQEANQVVVDLGAVTFLDSAGLSTLIATHQRAEAAGTTFRLRRVPPLVLRLLALTGMDSVLVIMPSPAESPPG